MRNGLPGGVRFCTLRSRIVSGGSAFDVGESFAVERRLRCERGSIEFRDWSFMRLRPGHADGREYADRGREDGHGK